MIKFILVALGLILALEKVPLAQAQVTLEVSKITCEQYNAYDTQRLVENARKLRDYCRRNPQTLVMQAVETLFAKER